MKQTAFFLTALVFAVAGVLIFNWGVYNSVPQSSQCTPVALLLTGDPACGWSDFAYFGSRVALAVGLTLALVGLISYRRDKNSDHQPSLRISGQEAAGCP